MKRYTKTETVRIVTAAAKDYAEKLCNKCFLLCYENGKEKAFVEFGFQAHNFKHLTGLECTCSAKQFYERALDGKLSPDSFEFDRHGNAHRKLAVLPMLPHIFKSPMLYGAFNNSGLFISADYFVGNTGKMISLGMRSAHPYDIPVSLYCEDIRRLSSKTVRILAIWDKPYKGTYSSHCYAAKDVDAEHLLKIHMGGKEKHD